MGLELLGRSRHRDAQPVALCSHPDELIVDVSERRRRAAGAMMRAGLVVPVQLIDVLIEMLPGIMQKFQLAGVEQVGTTSAGTAFLGNDEHDFVEIDRIRIVGKLMNEIAPKVNRLASSALPEVVNDGLDLVTTMIVEPLQDDRRYPGASHQNLPRVQSTVLMVGAVGDTHMAVFAPRRDVPATLGDALAVCRPCGSFLGSTT